MRWILLLLVLLIGCTSAQNPPVKDTTPPVISGGNVQVIEVVKLRISSPSFSDSEQIPSKFTCEGDDVNPELIIAGVPKEAKSLALIMDDLDAPPKVWEHWTLWNIPPEIVKIQQNSIPSGAIQGMNDFKRVDWGGPCPPPGKVHHYNFKLYALDTMLSLDKSAGKTELEIAMKNHIIEQAVLIGTYER